MVEIVLPEIKIATSMESGQEYLRRNCRAGTTCPCCGGFVKVYRRHLNAGMAASLIWLVTEFEKGSSWINVPRRGPRQVLANREMGRLIHWGLVKTKLSPNSDNPGAKTSGVWAPTEAGIRFVFEQSCVPDWIDLYQNRVVGKSEETIGIRDALKTKFNYDELMGKVAR